MLITIGEAVAYVVSGMYGDVRELGAGNAILIILQVLPLCLQAQFPGGAAGRGGGGGNQTSSGSADAQIGIAHTQGMSCQPASTVLRGIFHRS